MLIEQKHLTAFKKIIDKYQERTDFPEVDIWKTLSNNDLWIRLIGQVNVVGGEDGNIRFLANPSFSERLSYEVLVKLNNENLRKEINSVLSDAGVRYVSKDKEKISQKAKSLAKNFAFINSFLNGFVGLIEHVKHMNGQRTELDRADLLAEKLDFISHKTSRDFLMGLGINFNTLAIDSRIQEIFECIGLPIPSSYSKKTYEETEQQIVNGICKPLNILPVRFDRILFQNHPDLLKDIPIFLAN